LYRFEVRTGHGENVRSLINKSSRERLAAQIADICAFLGADFHGIHAWRLATNRVNASRGDFDVLAVASQAAKKPFRDGASTNVACADEEDVFHGSERAASAFINVEANLSKSIFSVQTSVIADTQGHNCDFSVARIVVIVTIVSSLFCQ
jgi:hypothetical protein